MIPWKRLGFPDRLPDRGPGRRRALSPRLERVEGRLLPSVFGVDSRVAVKDTTIHPFSAVVYIESAFADPGIGTLSGSGALIDPLHVLTAAHVVYNAGLQTGAVAITVVPGRNRSSFPYGAFNVNVVHVDPSYTDKLSSEGSDLAVLTLDRPIGQTTGVFGLRAEPDSFFTNNVLNTAGYPGDKGGHSGTRMFFAAGKTVVATPDLIAHKIDTSHGQSGAPLWEIIGDQSYIVGVHVFGKITKHSTNLAVRLTQAKVDEIRGWIAEDGSPINAIFKASSTSLTTAVHAQGIRPSHRTSHDVIHA